MGNRQETLGAVGSHPRQCSSTTEPGRDQMFWMWAISQPMGRLSSQVLQVQFVSPGRQTNNTYILNFISVNICSAYCRVAPRRGWQAGRQLQWQAAGGFSQLAIDVEESHNATCIPRDPTNAKAIYHCSNTINFKPQNEMWEISFSASVAWAYLCFLVFIEMTTLGI